MTPPDVYSKKVTVVGLAAQAGLLKGYQVDAEREKLLASALGRLSLLNSRRWINFMQEILPQILLGKGSLGPSLTKVERTMLTMLHYTLWGKGLSDLGNRFASPFTCLGFADFHSHYGSAPISIVWKMKEPLPGFVMKKTVKV